MFTDTRPDLQSLEQMMDAARIGWWKADFGKQHLLLSDFLAELFGLECPNVAISRLMRLIRSDYRKHIHHQLMGLKVENHFDETLPMIVPGKGEIWVHVQLVRRQSTPDLCIRLFGYAQQVPVRNRDDAEILTLESNYHAMLKENKHMDELLDHLPIGYFRIRLLYDDNGRATDYQFLSINRNALQTLGLHASKYINKTAGEIGIPVAEHIDKLAAIRLGDYKTERWYAPKAKRHCRSFLYNTPNDASEIVILILDITESVTAHKALDEQEKLLRNIIQNAPVGIEIYDREGRLVNLNASDIEMFGYPGREQMLGLSLFDEPNFPEQAQTLIRAGKSVDFTAQYDFARLGKYFHSTRCGMFDWTARFRCLTDAQGEATHYLLINIDNTELRRSQNRIAEFETLFSMVSEYARVGYANYDLCSREGYAQHVWLDNYGEACTATIHDVIGCYTHIHPEDRGQLLHVLQQFRSGAIRSHTMICRVLRGDGTTTWTKTHLICRDFQPEKGIIDMLGINYDVTPLKQTELELISAKERAEESNKLKSAFLANMSHEIRTPLNAIVGFSELLSSEEDASVRQEYVDIITLNNSLLLQIISDVLDLARIESGKIDVVRTEFDVRELCCEVTDTFRLQCRTGVQLRCEEGLRPLAVRQYRQGIMQIVGNFTRNALKFTDHGSVTIGYEQLPETLRIYVRDTGVGIAEGQLPHLFERFYKVDTFTQGTGLGLAICKSIAEQLGGQVGVESVVGAGSCFWLDLPAAE